jgi:type VI secretion system protein ImpH
MASQARDPSSSVTSELLKQGHAFSFFQAVRLLNLLCRVDSRSHKQEDQGRGTIRIRPELSLAFPASDIATIEELSLPEAGFLITATFLGLYGTSSPLPTFYSEDLFDDARESISSTRDFLDIIHQRLYQLLFRCWTKYRQFLQVIEYQDPQEQERLYCLVGLGEKELRQDSRESYSLIRYAGLFTQVPRSALGLETLLRDALGTASVEVIPCINCRVKIPPDQTISLGISGTIVGESMFLGEEIDDRMGMFRLRIGPLTIDQFQSLLPGSPDNRRLNSLTRVYLMDSLEYDVELVVSAGEIKRARLGTSRWSRLGLDTWIFSDGYVPGAVRVIFSPAPGWTQTTATRG